MESKWRNNVWQMGWSYSPIGLAARELGSEIQAITDWEVTPGQVQVLHRDALNPNDWVTHFFGTLPKLAPHFPYGYAVEPDQPP